MNSNKAIAVQAAALARQFWAAVAATSAGQIAACRTGRSVPTRMPGDPRPCDDETSPGWPARPADPLGVASSASRPIIDFVLDAAGIRCRFTTVVSADEVRAGKPAPDVYLLAAQQLGIAPPHILLFEDSSSGILAAHAVGMCIIALPNRTYPPASHVLALASAVRPSPAEVDLRQLLPQENIDVAAPTGV